MTIRPMALCVLILAALAPLAASADAVPPVTSQPTTQADPPEAAALLAVISRTATEDEARNPEAMRDYATRLAQAREALAKLHKDYPAIAARDSVRIAELDILFDEAYLRNDPEMADLRKAIAAVADDKSVGRRVRATAEFHLLTADAIRRSVREPTSQPADQKARLLVEIDLRIAFGRAYADLEIGRQAFGGAILRKCQLDGYEAVLPLVADFVKTFPDRAGQAFLLSQLMFSEYQRHRDGWAKAKPIADRLAKEYRDEPVTAQSLSVVTMERARTDPAGALTVAESLTKDYPGNESVARIWRDLTIAAYRQQKPDLIAVRLKVLAEAFPKAEARVETLATLIHMDFRQKGLDAVLPAAADLGKQFPKSPIVTRLYVLLAGEQLEKVGYEKAAPFINDVLKTQAGTPDAMQLERYVQQWQTRSTQPEMRPRGN